MSSSEPTADRPLAGIMFMLLGAFLMTAMDACTKWLASDYSVAQIICMRGLVSVAIIAALVWRDEGASGFKMANPMAHAGRTILMMMLASAMVIAVRFLPLADVGALFMVAPLLATGLGALILKERIGLSQSIAIAVGFAGMLLIMRPGSAVFTTVALIPAACALGYAIYIISTRALSATETTGALTFYPQAGIFLVALAFAPFAWSPIAWQDVWVFIALGLCAGVGHLCLTLAFRYAPVAVVAPLDYTALIWAVGLGFWVFGDLPDMITVLGMGFITVAGLVVIHRQNRRDKTAAA